MTTTTPVKPARIRLGWQEHLRDAADLAALGFVLVLAALPVLTAGAALATGSHAIRHRCDHGRYPPLSELLRTFARAILPGLAATLVVAVAGGLLALDASAARSGSMPGGAATLPLIMVVGLIGMGYLGIVVVHIGWQGGTGWRRAVRSAISYRGRSLILVPSSAGVLAIAYILASFIPATVPLVVAFSLFALHVIHRKVTT
jgi:hypothetical protein